MDCKLPSRAEVERLKSLYRAGSRVALLWMNDPQAPPAGTAGTVTSVDDMGSIHVDWDNGSRLSLAAGEDMFRRLE